MHTSLLISTYNWKEALKACLQSVFNQSILPDEILIADDGSQDGTKEMIREMKLQTQIPIIHVWHQDKGFRVAAIRNRAIEMAKGDYIIQIDGDVILHKYFIADHLELAERGYFVCGSRVWLREETTDQILKGDIIMNKLKIFENEEFGQLSVIVKNNKEYIEAIEVATILGYSNPRDAISRHCNEEGVVFSDVRVVTGIKKDNSKAFKVVTKKFIDEGNLYRLIIKSKLPSARRFEKWVMDEVLPSIRKHGAYMSEEVINKTLDDPDFIIEMATKLKYEREQRRLLEEKAKHLEATITIDKPYTNFGKSIATSSDAITIGQFAKVLNNNNINIGRNRLFTILRDNGYLIKVGKDKNMPKQIYVKQGLFKVAESIVKTVKGELLTATTLITGKGQMYFLELFSNLTENKTYIS